MKLSAPSLLVGAVAVALPAYVLRVAVVNPVRVVGVPSAEEMVRGSWSGGSGVPLTAPILTVPLDRRLVIVSVVDAGGFYNVSYQEVETNGSVNPISISVLPVALQPGSQFVITTLGSTNGFGLSWSGYYEDV
jgi:hypothetical protein